MSTLNLVIFGVQCGSVLRKSPVDRNLEKVNVVTS